MNCGSCRPTCPRTCPRCGTGSGLADELNEVLDDLREMSRGIHPAILSEGGLRPALRMLAHRAALPVELDPRTDSRYPGPVEAAIYYVVSEALTNAAKHARARTAWISLEERDTALRLAVRDDGAGGADPGQGSGLVSLHDRVEALGRTLELTSRPGEGTLINVMLPAALAELAPDTRPTAGQGQG